MNKLFDLVADYKFLKEITGTNDDDDSDSDCYAK